MCECHLLTRPVPLTSMFLNKIPEKNDGSLQISFVIVINAAIHSPPPLKTTVKMEKHT